MSKWTDWIPHEGDECPVDGDEIVRVKFRQNGGSSKQDRTMLAGGWLWDYKNQPSTITHYKRFRKNVEAEKAKKTKAAAEKSWTEANERANDEYAAKLSQAELERDIHESARHDPEAERTSLLDRLTLTPEGARSLGISHTEALSGVKVTIGEDITPSKQAAITDDLSTLKDRHETRRGPFVITDEDIDATTPTPIITGPGEYVTRKGEKAVVSHVDGGSLYPFVGKVGVQVVSWTGHGEHWKEGETDFDITGPWQEPEKAEEPEMWVNVYEGLNGDPVFHGGIRDSLADARSWAMPEGFIGTYKLVKDTTQ